MVTAPHQPAMLDLALDALHHGLAVVPPAEDGTKRPAGPWQTYQHRLPTEDELRSWYANGRHGIGIVCGAVSGNLEMLEFEGRAMGEAVDERFADLADQAGIGDLVANVMAGYTEWTPSGGLHILYRVDGPIAGNTKLARRPATANELEQQPDDRIKVLIETRGEGGYVIVAPTHGPVHPTAGEWRLVQGGFDSIATITPAERDQLHRLARALDDMPVNPPTSVPSATQPMLATDRPGDLYNQQPDATTRTLQLLQQHGWQHVFDHPHAGHTDHHLRRPGKNDGTSAVLHGDGGTLYVFSTSTSFTAEEPYTPFAVYTQLEHHGDYRAAARQLRPGDAPHPDLTDLVTTPAPPGTAPPTIELDARPFEITRVGAYIAAGITEPDYVPGPLPWLYAGRLTAIQSEPGVGKTWLALRLALHAIAANTDVVYLDEEGGPELIAERLIRLGATPEQIDQHLLYIPFPSRQWDLADQAGFHQLLDQHPNTQLAVFDSLPDFLAMAAKSEDSAQDVTWWINRVCGICRAHGVAQIVLDHLPKPDADAKRRTRSRYSRGSGAKLAKADATLLLETGREFDAHRSGQLKLWKTKDRRGRLTLPSLGSNPVLIDVQVTDNHLDFDVRDPEPDKPTNERHFRPTAFMERLSDSLEQHNTKGIKPSANKLLLTVKGKTDLKREALRCLIDEGYVTFEAGPNNSTLHVLLKPYRQLTDPKSDNFMVLHEGDQ
jgi:KaiC/GvpD/RAD55 family RecA-like ATPase